MQLGYAMFCIILSFFFTFLRFWGILYALYVNDNIFRKVRISQALWRTVCYFYTYFQIQKDHMFSHNDDWGPFYLDIFDAELKSTD